MKSTKDSLLEDIKAEFAEVNAMMEALEAKEPEDEALSLIHIFFTSQKSI